MSTKEQAAAEQDKQRKGILFFFFFFFEKGRSKQKSEKLSICKRVHNILRTLRSFWKSSK